jgi:hypothetical protein
MELKIIGEHIVVTPAMHDYIESKFQALHIPEMLIHAEFRVRQEKNNFVVSFLSNYNHKPHFIENHGETFYETSDLLMDKIKRSFNEYKKPRPQSLKKII